MVVLVDVVHRAVVAAVRRHERIIGIVAEARALPIREESVDLIVCVSYLDRSLFQTFANLLVPDGILVYETFTRAHLDLVARGRAHGPKNPRFLLNPGELPQLVPPLVIRQHEEGLVVDDAGERHVARVMAVKP